MEEKIKKANTKPRQFEKIVHFMRNHPDLAKGQINGLAAKQKCNQLWARLAEDLNLNGPPTHRVVEWKKIWADYKNHIKSKLRRNKLNMSGTGGGPSKFMSLTPLEEEVASLLHINDTVNGTPGVKKFGKNDTAENADAIENNIDEEIDAVEQNVNANPNVLEKENTTSNVNSHSEVRDINANRHVPQGTFTVLPDGMPNLLKYQVQNQCAYHENSIKILNEISEHQKTISRYARKSFELKEKKLKLAKEKFEFKKKDATEKLKLKKEKLKIKKQMLDLELDRLNGTPKTESAFL